MPEDRVKHFIVPVFIPNQGCPHRCIFCEQRKISSQKKRSMDGAGVTRIIEDGLRSKKFDPTHAEVAFYGGTFTSLDPGTMAELLNAAAQYLKKGLFCGIRVSTRPDALDGERLDLMKSHGVKIVELGIQSMDPRVLFLSGRGHSAEDSEKAVHILREKGFRVGVQLMPGLPGDSGDIFLSTVEKIRLLGPDMARIYPTLVIRGTGLARLYRGGGYVPLTLEQAVEMCAEGCVRLENAGIPVIRVGLMSSPDLLNPGQVLAGPWHTAFGFLVRCKILQKIIEPQLPPNGRMFRIKIRIQDRDIPLLRGYRNEGLRWVASKTGADVTAIEGDHSLPSGKIEVSRG